MMTNLHSTEKQDRHAIMRTLYVALLLALLELFMLSYWIVR
jgi:hypothetical protein